jgi:hypothetical protein
MLITLGACGIVKGCEIRVFLDSLQDALRHENGPAKIFASMHDAMSDRFDLHILADPEKLNDPEECIAMIGAGYRLLVARSGRINQF